MLNFTVSSPDFQGFDWNSSTYITTDIFDVDNSTVASNLTTVAPLVVSPLAKKVSLICYTYIGPIICAFGIFCNIINLMVLSQHHLKESPYTYLTGLAFTDFLALFFSFIFMVISHKSQGYFWRFYEAHIFLPLTNVCTNSSVWIVVLLTIERFLFVSNPLWAKAKCDRASAKLKIAIIIFAMLIFNIPRFMVFKVTQGSDGLHILGSTEFRQSEFFHIMTWVYAFVIQIIPLIILCFSNAYLVFAVMRARQQRQILQIRNNKEAAWYREQVRLTITLISIVCLFIVCILPSAISDFPIAYNLFGGDMSERAFRMHESYLILQYVANVLVWCNLSLNFVLYCAFNDKFRRVMRCMLRRWLNCLHWRRKDGTVLLLVNFKSGQSIHRTSSQTNSITLNTKVSTLTQDAILLNGKSDHALNNHCASTGLFEKTDQSDKEEEAE